MASKTALESSRTICQGLKTLWIHGGSTSKYAHGFFSSAFPSSMRSSARSYGGLGPKYPSHHGAYASPNPKSLAPRCPLCPRQKIPSYDRRLLSTESLTEKWKSAAVKLKQTVTQNSSLKINLEKVSQNIPKGLDRPLNAVKSTVSRYREAAGLQVEAFWKRNYLILVGALGVGLCIVLWRIMFGIASTFVGLSEGMAKYGFLALATAVVAFAGLYVRARFTINPNKVYRMAMRKLNTSAAVLEVMGAPLSGSDLRAYVMSGGSIRLKNFKPRLSSKRCFLIFPIQGSERRGLVSVEVKKKKGQYDFKLLAVDIPMANGPDQRLFLIGDEEEYKVGGGLISELRDPIVKAMAAEKEFEDGDQKEQEEDEQRELMEEENLRQHEIEKLEKERIS